MNVNRSTLLAITGVLFCLAAGVTAFGKAKDPGMAIVWLALGVAFFALARSESKKTKPAILDSDSRRPLASVLDKSHLFARDSIGRTPLFYAAERGDLEEVRRIIFSLAGTGIYCQRLALIEIEDSSGLTAADVAEQAGHTEIAALLRGEQGRMEFFE